MRDVRALTRVVVRETPPHCATCPHYHVDLPEAGYGECRLEPKAPAGNPEAGTTCLRYALTAATDFCTAHPDALTEPRI